jgi:hypothetical protein
MLQGIGIDPIIIGPPIDAPARPGSEFSRQAGLASLGPLGMLIGADLDLVDVALRIGAGVIGVALLIAGGFLIVKEQQAGLIGNVVKGVIK